LLRRSSVPFAATLASMAAVVCAAAIDLADAE
jgi:hypothetical protein